jgi:methanol metabolism-related c-type cytochrome
VEHSPCSHCRSSELKALVPARGFARAPDQATSKAEEKLLRIVQLITAAVLLIAAGGTAFADGSGDPAAVKSENGKYLDSQGNPTYKIQSDGTVDWYTYSGYRRYHSECHVCHGPDGMGSSYAPALKDSLKTMSYGEFLSIVASGRKNISTSQENVMPAFGDNPNVTCYLDDIYAYLRARANDAVARVRPAKHEDKSPAYTQAENSCMGTKH